MKHRDQPRLSVGVRRALAWAVLLLSTMASMEAHASWAPPAAPRSEPQPTPYLPVLGMLALRFQEAATPPAAAVPPSGSASLPVSTSPDTVAKANAESAPSTPAATPENTTADATFVASGSEEPSVSPSKVPRAILPDDARKVVRPEDFLPYFQIPGTALYPEDVTLLVPAPQAAPAPAAIPPSSATYTQTPK